MKFDEYKTIINDQENYKDIAKQLVEGEGAVLGPKDDSSSTSLMAGIINSGELSDVV